MSIFGKGFGKRDDDYHKDYQHDIERMRREHEEHLKLAQYDSQRQMNMAQGAIQGSGYQSGWNDPRGMMGARPSTPSVEELYENVKRNNVISREMVNKMNRIEKKVEMLTGFYTWVTEVYPEIAAQHKAMRDLYEAANSGETQTPEAS